VFPPTIKQVLWGQVRVHLRSYLQFSSRPWGLHLPPQAFVLFFAFALLVACLFIFFSFMFFLLLKAFAFYCQFVYLSNVYPKKGWKNMPYLSQKTVKNACFLPILRVQ
jgi:hypothetical protein